MTRPSCVQWIATATGTRQCSRPATHVLPGRPNVTTCTQHARSYDVPLPKESRR